jgi:cellobiose phosphorylase
MQPCIPDGWPGFAMTYTLDDGTQYQIAISNPDGNAGQVVLATFDGATVEATAAGVVVPLRGDGAVHALSIVMGAAG